MEKLGQPKKQINALGVHYLRNTSRAIRLATSRDAAHPQMIFRVVNKGNKVPAVPRPRDRVAEVRSDCDNSEN